MGKRNKKRNYSFYIQHSEDATGDYNTFLNLEKKFGCKYCSFTGLMEQGAVSNTYTESFDDAEFPKVYTPDDNNVLHDSTECKLVLLWKASKDYKVTNRELKFQRFISGKKVVYYDNFRCRYFVLLFSNQPSLKDELLHGGQQYRQVEYTFTNLSGTSYSENPEAQYDIELTIIPEGDRLKVETSRALRSDEYITLETKGSNTNCSGWHVLSPCTRPNYDYSSSFCEYKDEYFKCSFCGLNTNCGWSVTNTMKQDKVVRILKAKNSRFLLPLRNNIQGKITYALSVVTSTSIHKSKRAYFQSNMLVVDSSKMEIKTWFSV
jgi:hypothetical protein